MLFRALEMFSRALGTPVTCRTLPYLGLVPLCPHTHTHTQGLDAYLDNRRIRLSKEISDLLRMIASETAPTFLGDVQREDVEISVRLEFGDQKLLIFVIREGRRDQRSKASAFRKRRRKTFPANSEPLNAIVLLTNRFLRLGLKSENGQKSPLLQRGMAYLDLQEHHVKPQRGILRLEGEQSAAMKAVFASFLTREVNSHPLFVATF